MIWYPSSLFIYTNFFFLGGGVMHGGLSTVVKRGVGGKKDYDFTTGLFM